MFELLSIFWLVHKESTFSKVFGIEDSGCALSFFVGENESGDLVGLPIARNMPQLDHGVTVQKGIIIISCRPPLPAPSSFLWVMAARYSDVGACLMSEGGESD